MNRTLKLWVKCWEDKNITSKGIGAEKSRGERGLVETEGYGSYFNRAVTVNRAGPALQETSWDLAQP